MIKKMSTNELVKSLKTDKHSTDQTKEMCINKCF